MSFNRQVSLIKSGDGFIRKHCSVKGWLNKMPSSAVARDNITYADVDEFFFPYGPGIIFVIMCVCVLP